MLDRELRRHRRKLEVAINEALTESPEITSTILRIRDKGYDVFLIIEATIGLNRKDAAGHESATSTSSRLELSSQDEKFLRSLKISPK